MTPEQMAHIHSDAFTQERGWSASEFAELLAQPYTHVLSDTAGFALTRTLAGETELLTLAVAPKHQRCGIARKLLNQWLSDSFEHADTAFLDVAADNAGALALYDSLSFQRSGLRKAYYTRKNGSSVDAVLMTRSLT
jgi:ribosomal-protein-alanine N-acetyltransferase